MVNIYQHCRDVHQASYKTLKHGGSKESASDLYETAASAINDFAVWLKTIDGLNLEAPSVLTYRTQVRKVLQLVCEGSLEGLQDYNKWSEQGNLVDQLKETLAASTVQGYLRSLSLFFEFLKTPKANKHRILTKLSNQSLTAGIALFQKWSLGFRKSKQAQKTKVVAESQKTIPKVAMGMKAFSTSEQSKWVLLSYMFIFYFIFCF